MNMFKRVAVTAATLTLSLGLLTGCGDKRITQANVNEVTEGMSRKQVESILGPPTSVDTKDLLILKTTTYIYRQGKETVTIVFKEDKLVTKQSTLSE